MKQVAIALLVLLAPLVCCNKKKPTQPPGDATVIKGVVTDSSNGLPLGYTSVSLASGLSATTDSNGRYRLIGMGGGSFSLNFDRPDYHLNSDAVTVTANDSQVLNIKLCPCQWQVVQIPLPEPWGTNLNIIRDLCFINENEGWAAGFYYGLGIDEGYGAILHTNDGGFTWSMQYGCPNANESYWDVDFVDNQHGWVGGSGLIKYTIDGGTSWSTCSASEICISFNNAQTGWYASLSYVYKTTDGGVTWNYISTYDTYLPAQDRPLKMIFINQSTGWIRTRMNLYRTIDGGQTWTMLFNNLPDAAGGWHMPGAALSALPQGQVWVEGKYSPDNGNTWQNQPCDTGGKYFSSSFCESRYGWMSKGNTLYHTIDGGNTWTDTTMSGLYEINALQFISRRRGWAAAAGRKILIYK